MADAGKIDFFISYRSSDESWATWLAWQLEEAGYTTFLQAWDFRPGTNFVAQMQKGTKECAQTLAVLTPAYCQSGFTDAEWFAAFAQDPTGSQGLLLPVRVADCDVEGLLGQVIYVNLVGLDEAAARERLFAGVKQSRAKPSRPPSFPGRTAAVHPKPGFPGTNPYRGLEAFRAEHRDVFKGRGRYVEAVRAKLESKRLVAIVGASGSGKSSLAMAGVLPALVDEGWLTAEFRPLRDPFAELALGLINYLKPSVTDPGPIWEAANKYAHRFRKKPVDFARQLSFVVEQSGENRRLLILSDQFDELFSQASQADRTAFIDLIFKTWQDPEAPIKWLVTLRADFMEQALQSDKLTQLLQDADVKLGPMNENELRAAIVEPAAAQGVRFADGLPERLIDDAIGSDGRDSADDPAAHARAGRLPLLEFALHQLWDRQRDNQIPHDAYDHPEHGIGGVQGALRRHAETVFAGLDEGQRLRASRLFRRLVQRGPRANDVRRIVPRPEVESDWDDLVQPLANVRLLMTSEPSPHQATVEVIHEELLRAWPQLRTWIDENREFDHWRQGLTEQAARWQAAPATEKPDLLLRGTQLDQALIYLAERSDELTALEQEFIDAARSERSRADADRRAAERRQLVRARIIASIMAVLLVAATVLSIFAYDRSVRERAAREEADRQRDGALITQSRLLSSLSAQATQVGDAVKGMLLSIAALPGSGPSGNRPYTEEPELSLQSAYVANRERAVLPHGDRVPIGLTLFSPDSAHVLTALGPGIISSESAPARLWDTRNGAHLLALEGAIADTEGRSPEELADERRAQAVFARHLTNAVFSRDGRRLLTVLWKSSIKVWDLKSGATTLTLGYSDNQRVETAVYSPDEAYIITKFTDGDTTKSGNPEAGGGIFRLSDSTTGVAVDEINGVEGLKRIAFSPDGGRMVTQDKQDRITLWNAGSRQPIAILDGHRGEVTGVAFSPDGTQIASVSRDMTVRLWAAESGRELGVLKGHEDSVSLAIFSPSGRQLLTASSDKTARLWNINPLRSSPVSELRGHQAAVTGAAFNADGSRIITRSEDKTSRLWNADTGSALSVFSVEESGSGSSTASTAAEFSSDGLKVLSFSDRFSRAPAGLWSAETGDELAELGTAEAASFSPDGTRILTVSRDLGTRLWDSFDREPYAILSQPGARLDRALFSPDGNLVITVSDDIATLWDARQAASFGSRFAESHGFRSEALSPDGKFRVRRIYEERDSNALAVVEVTGDRQVARLEGHQERVSSMAFGAAGTRILTASEDGTARIWSAITGKELRALRGSSADGFRMAEWSPDDQRVVTVSNRGGVDLWDPQVGEHLAELDGGDARFSNAVTFSADGTRLATVPFPEAGSKSRAVRIWKAGRGALVTELKGHEGRITSIAFSSNGQRVLTGSADKTARIWDSGTGELLATFHCDGQVESAQFSGDGTRILIQSLDANAKSVVSLWNAGPGERIVQLSVRDSIGTSATFTADGAYVLKASSRGSGGDTSLWDSKTGKRLAVLRGAQGSEGPLGIQYRDDTAVIRDVSSGAELVVLKGHRGVIRGASLSVDDSRAVTIGEDDRTIRQWDVKTGAQLSVSPVDEAMFEKLVSRYRSDDAPDIAVTPDGTRVLAQGRGYPDEYLFVLRTFPSTEALLDETMRESARCLSLEERRTAYLEEEPPAWCIEQGKWPYHTLRWRAWLDAKLAGQNPAYPVAGQTVATGADEAYQAGRFEEAMKLQALLADTFLQATTTIPGGEPATAASVFAHLSRYALFSKDFDKALSAADRAIELQAEKFLLLGTPDINAYMNKAHALMFLGWADEALAIHRKYRGHEIDVDGDSAKRIQNIGKDGSEEITPTLWEDGVRADFDRFRALGMDHPQIAGIERELAGSGPPLQTVIEQVLPNSQAAQIGLQSGDVIQSYDGERISRLQTLIAAVQRPGDDQRELTILRDGQSLQFQVAPGLLGVKLRETAANTGESLEAPSGHSDRGRE